MIFPNIKISLIYKSEFESIIFTLNSVIKSEYEIISSNTSFVSHHNYNPIQFLDTISQTSKTTVFTLPTWIPPCICDIVSCKNIEY